MPDLLTIILKELDWVCSFGFPTQNTHVNVLTCSPGAYGAHELRLITIHLQNIKASQQIYRDILSFDYTLEHISYLSHARENLWDEVSNFLSQIKGLVCFFGKRETFMSTNISIDVR